MLGGYILKQNGSYVHEMYANAGNAYKIEK